ncbi:MAG: hypothetical protein HZB19_19905 [Chloroflexi bacterium]|nr:hypothetical protein [Chloroflexota bacterium]
MNNSKTSALGQMPVFLGILTFILAFFILSRTPSDADMWWHLRAGQLMWEQKTILLTDQFSYTRAGSQWTNAFWLAEIAFYLLYRYGGYFAIATFVALAGGITFLLIYRRLSGNHLLNSVVILLGVLTAAPIWSPRPQIFSFFLLAWLDRFLDERRQGKARPLWALIPLFIFWANIHGGWIWGFLLLLSSIAGDTLDTILAKQDSQNNEKWKSISVLVLWTISAALAIGLNPNGLSIWRLPFYTVDVSMQIQEWLSPDFHRIDFHPLLWMVFLLIVTASLANKKTAWSAMIKVTGFAYLTFVAQRNIAPFAIIAVPVLALWANAAFEEILSLLPSGKSKFSSPPLSPALRTIINSLILVMLSMTAIIRGLWLSTPEKVNQNYPADAVHWIQSSHPEGRLFNSYNWGGYLTWTLPEYPVFIDGRADLYGNEIILQWQEITRGTDQSLQLLEEWKINIVLLEPERPLVKVLEERGWTVAFRDEISVVLVNK